MREGPDLLGPDAELTIPKIVELFVGDMLLPSTTEKMTPTEMLPALEAYCAMLGVPQVTIVGLGRELQKFYHRRRSMGKRYYYCRWKPGVIEEDDNE